MRFEDVKPGMTLSHESYKWFVYNKDETHIYMFLPKGDMNIKVSKSEWESDTHFWSKTDASDLISDISTIEKKYHKDMIKVVFDDIS